jgi:2-dehydro-3-deoxygalactonokinase
VDAGSIVDFATYLTGELYAVLLAHSILGRLARTGSAAASESDAAFARGVTRGVAEGELARDIFGARTLALTGELAPDLVSEWLSGLLIGREIRAARTWAHAGGGDTSRVRVIGSDALVDRYLRALSLVGIIAEPARPDAAAKGLHRIAHAMGLAPSLA